ncbi:MAG: lysine--tRNA ligase, partial [bacterium]
MPDLNEIVENRYQKAASIRQEGGNPYVNRFAPTHTSAQVLAQADGLIESQGPVIVAGRALQLRSFGKSCFFHLKDGAGQVQIYVKKGITDEADAERFQKYMDSGDILGIEGQIFRTKTGEVTVAARRVHLLTKAVQPLPEKWHGLKNRELRYRRRYVDLIANQEVRTAFEVRSRLLAALRRHLDDKGYVEVETPMLQPLYGGAAARPFTTHHNTLDLDLYLRIAPELYLKRLVVGGMEKVYEINRNFRNEGISTRHNPEFTMLELYTAYWDYGDTMNLTEEMFKAATMAVKNSLKIEYQGQSIDLEKPFERVTMVEAVGRAIGAPVAYSMSPADLISVVRSAKEDGVATELEAQHRAHAQKGDARNATPELIVWLFERLVEDGLVQPTFVTEFPKSLSPLATSKADDPSVAERFELFVGRLEVANAYSELNDPAEQRRRFVEQVERRKAGDLEAVGEVDHDYLLALEYGMPPTSGLGVGIDRMV